MNFKAWLESNEAEEHAQRKAMGAKKYASSSRSDHRPKGGYVGPNPRYGRRQGTNQTTAYRDVPGKTSRSFDKSINHGQEE